MEKLDQSAETKWELTVTQIMNSFFAKFRLKLNKIGKTNISCMYDLNQTSYDYTVKMGNRFKESDLTECLMNYGQRFVTLKGSRKSPRKRHATNQNGCLRRPYK